MLISFRIDLIKVIEAGFIPVLSKIATHENFDIRKEVNFSYHTLHFPILRSKYATNISCNADLHFIRPLSV